MNTIDIVSGSVQGMTLPPFTGCSFLTRFLLVQSIFLSKLIQSTASKLEIHYPLHTQTLDKQKGRTLAAALVFPFLFQTKIHRNSSLVFLCVIKLPKYCSTFTESLWPSGSRVSQWFTTSRFKPPPKHIYHSVSSCLLLQVSHESFYKLQLSILFPLCGLWLDFNL